MLDTGIEEEKKEQILSCLALKSEYEQMDLIYDQNLLSMKEARK